MTDMRMIAEAGAPLLITSASFDAPPELVFRTSTEPELLVQWLGPRRYTMRVERNEVRDGGRWRFVHSDERGNELGFHGVFHGDPSPQAIGRTFEHEGTPGPVPLGKLTLEERDGRTWLREVSA